jgi:ABC-type sugar transport system permease subunit
LSGHGLVDVLAFIPIAQPAAIYGEIHAWIYNPYNRALAQNANIL